MPATPTVVTNAVVYLDGRNLLGRTEEFTPPVVKDVLQDLKPLGLMSAIKVPTGTIEAMEAKYKWAGVDRELLQSVADPETSVMMMVRAQVKSYGARGVLAVEELVMQLNGPITESGLGGFKQSEGLKPESTQQIWYYKLMIGGRLISEVDVFTNVRKKGEVDVLERFRAFVGV